MDWYDNYNIGSTVIDNQHRAMVAIISRLQKALLEGHEELELGNTLRFLVDYTRHHFHDEEELMKNIGFPELERQREMHRRLVSDVNRILLNLKHGKTIDPIEMTDYLVDWLMHHILHEDKKISKYLKPEQPHKATAPNIEGKLHKLNAMLTENLISDDDYASTRQHLLQNLLNEEHSVDDKLCLIHHLQQEELISDAEHDQLQQELFNRFDIEAFLREEGEANDKLQYLKTAADSGMITAEDFEKYKQQLLHEL